jgi:hypothetical protein
MARKALELPILRMQLSEHVRLEQLRTSYESPVSKRLDQARLIKKPCSIQNGGWYERAARRKRNSAVK